MNCLKSPPPDPPDEHNHVLPNPLSQVRLPLRLRFPFLSATSWFPIVKQQLLTFGPAPFPFLLAYRTHETRFGFKFSSRGDIYHAIRRWWSSATGHRPASGAYGALTW